MSRSRQRPASASPDCRSGNSSSSEAVPSQQERPAVSATSSPGSHPLMTHLQPSAPLRRSAGSQRSVYRTPQRQQRGEGRTGTAGRRRGPAQELPRHTAFQPHPLTAPQTAGVHSERPRRAQSPAQVIQTTVPLSYGHPHVYVPPSPPVGYRLLTQTTAHSTGALPSGPHSHSTTMHTEPPADPNQPLVTQTEEGLTYYTYGPFQNVPVYGRRPVVPTAGYGPSIRLQPQHSTMASYAPAPLGGSPSPSLASSQVTAASYSQGRPPRWAQLAPQPRASGRVTRTGSGSMQHGEWRSGRPGASQAQQPPLQPPPFRSSSGEASSLVGQPGRAPRSRPFAQSSHSIASTSDVSIPESVEASDIGNPDAGLEQQTVPARSEHVMWVGNVPANATQEELRAFFASRLPRSEIANNPNDPTGGIVSIFIISRSNCAFVNFASAAILEEALQRFNGAIFRSQERKGSRLVCRVRKKEEEGQSGVAGQRRKHIHVAWLKDHNRRLRTEAGPEAEARASALEEGRPASQCTDLRSDSSAADISVEQHPSDSVMSSDDSANVAGEGGSVSSSSAEVSYASTNSDMLRHPAFRKRFFILKSANVQELDHAVHTGMWSTQPHNEKVLDQAFRTSEEVILIFSANQSGAFYGYAKMVSSIFSKTGASATREGREAMRADPETSQDGPSSGATSSRDRPATVIFSDDMVNASPEPLTPKEDSSTLRPSTKAGAVTSVVSELEGGGTSTPTGPRPPELSPAPPARPFTQSQLEMSAHQEAASMPSSTVSAHGDGVVRRDMAFAGMVASVKEADPSTAASITTETSLAPGDSASADAEADERSIEASAIIHNMRLNQPGRGNFSSDTEGQGGDSRAASETGSKRSEAVGTAVHTSVGQEESEPGNRLAQSEPLGSRFAIQWLQTRPLPFSAVKRMRNAWNENRSIRVARDGTEVAIDTGCELCEVWERYVSTP